MDTEIRSEGDRVDDTMRSITCYRFLSESKLGKPQKNDVAQQKQKFFSDRYGKLESLNKKYSTSETKSHLRAYGH